MKLRIKGNSLRLRLSQPEVAQFREDGHVEERIRFGPGRRLLYVLEATDVARQLRARFDGERIVVQVPAARAATWTGTDQVSLEGEQSIEGDEVLTILVEKDFQCLHKEPEAKDPDAFPHPLEQ